MQFKLTLKYNTQLNLKIQPETLKYKNIHLQQATNIDSNKIASTFIFTCYAPTTIQVTIILDSND